MLDIRLTMKKPHNYVFLYKYITLIREVDRQEAQRAALPQKEDPYDIDFEQYQRFDTVRSCTVHLKKGFDKKNKSFCVKVKHQIYSVVFLHIVVDIAKSSLLT